MKKQFQLFILLFIVCFSCLGQDNKATIFFKDGDSIGGYAFIKKNKVKFRITLDEKGEYWDSRSINRVEFKTFFGVKAFEYVKLSEKGSPILLEEVVEGLVTFYRGKTKSWSMSTYNGIGGSDLRSMASTQVTKITNYLKRKEDEYPSCLNCGFFKNWKKRTIDFLIDCPVLVEKIKLREYEESDLQEIIEYYNIYCVEFE